MTLLEKQDYINTVLAQIIFGLPWPTMHSARRTPQGILFQLLVHHRDATKPNAREDWWRGREWFIPEDATEEAVVRTALMAAETYMLHEIRERFTYRAQRVFDPHKEVL